MPAWLLSALHLLSVLINAVLAYKRPDLAVITAPTLAAVNAVLPSPLNRERKR